MISRDKITEISLIICQMQYTLQYRRLKCKNIDMAIISQITQLVVKNDNYHSA